MIYKGYKNAMHYKGYQIVYNNVQHHWAVKVLNSVIETGTRAQCIEYIDDNPIERYRNVNRN